jgi:uncharacterized protein (DUF1501 family)
MSTPVSRRFSRRQWLQGLGAGIALIPLFTRNVWAQAATSAVRKPGQGRLVVVLLRGAYDGLSAFVPYADADYYALRPNIAIAAPDGTAQTSLKLDNSFALHPSLAPLLPLWQQGVLSFVPAAGLPAPNRSHFDAQFQMEIAQPGKSNAASGWLNRLAGFNATPTPTAMGVGEANPAILAGDARVKLIPRGVQAERTGVLASTSARQALLDLYAGNDAVSVAFRKGAESRMQSSQELTDEKNAVIERRRMDTALDKDGTPATTQAQSAQMLAASNGATDPAGLVLDAQHLGTLMRNDRSLSIGFLSAGGWDTHANQGNVTGQLANNLANLARGIAQLRQDFSESGDVILVMSEFGRTSAENGTRGTDHGFGNALWLIGNRVNGGKWHGQWTGLARGNLNENRDLPAHHDYRAVLAQVFKRNFAMTDSGLAALLPGANWDARLDGLMRRA